MPPSSKEGCEKACDLAIKYLTHSNKHQIFCFAEAKRAKNHTYSKIRDLEVQAGEYCLEFLEANPEVARVFACTLVGASIRCWDMERGATRLRPFWGKPAEHDFTCYIDVGDDHLAHAVETAFSHMKAVPVGNDMPFYLDYDSIGRRNPTGYLSTNAGPSCSSYIHEDEPTKQG